MQFPTPHTITITNPDGSKNGLTVFETENADTSIVIFPAMGIKASYYAPFALELSKNGITAATVDLRGNGNSSLRPSKNVDFNYSDTLRNDYHTAIGEMKQRYPNNKLYLLGHSLGGQLACLYSAKNKGIADGIILVASGNVFYKGWQGLARYKTLLGTQFIGVIAKLLGYFPGKKIGFGGLEAKGIIADWSRHARNGKYVLSNDNFNYEQAMQEMKIPIFALTFEGDALASKTSASYLYNKFTNNDRITHRHLLRKDALNEGFNHFSWVKKPKNPVKIICDWIKQLQ